LTSCRFCTFWLVVNALRATGKFRDLTLKQDEAEHCVELHLPFIRRLFAPDVKLVPIVVGSLKDSKEEIFADILAPCEWGDCSAPCEGRSWSASFPAG
jgi:AmmeMemoRadiSam system protein B